MRISDWSSTCALPIYWKFVHEDLMDFYHVNVLHAGTCGSKFSWENDDVVLKRKGGLSIFYKAGPPTPGAEPLHGKMPWMQDHDISFACTGFMQPNRSEENTSELQSLMRTSYAV